MHDIHWGRTFAILGAIGFLVAADHGLDQVDFAFDERQIAHIVDNGEWHAHGGDIGWHRRGHDEDVASEEVDSGIEDDWDAFETDMNKFETEMERLGAEMERLSDELEADHANRAAIEAEMSRVGEKMARLAIGGAATALRDAFAD